MAGIGLDQVMLDHYHLDVGAAKEARDWWRYLPDDYKGSVSIWVLLAVYAAHAAQAEGRYRQLLEEHMRVCNRPMVIVTPFSTPNAEGVAPQANIAKDDNAHEALMNAMPGSDTDVTG